MVIVTVCVFVCVLFVTYCTRPFCSNTVNKIGPDNKAQDTKAYTYSTQGNSYGGSYRIYF